MYGELSQLNEQLMNIEKIKLWLESRKRTLEKKKLNGSLRDDMPLAGAYL